jgi:hypothetical protein
MHHLLLAQRYREYYYLNANKNTRNILNWLLIAMMVMLPLRSVMALAQTTCEMHGQASLEMEGHSMHTMHMMNEDAQADNGATQNRDCCKSGKTCTGDCCIGISVSFITQSAVLLPEFNEAAFNPLVNNSLVSRNLAPPVRPPANLQV